MSLAALLAIAAGASLGAWLRWGLGLWLNPLFPSLPLGTLAANLGGGYLMGLAMAWLGQNPALPAELRLALTVGFLGGLTTFSSFSGEAVTLIGRGEYLGALAHSGAHLLGSLLMTALGMASFQLLAAALRA